MICFFNSNIECVSPEFIIKEFEKYRRDVVEKSKLDRNNIKSFFFLLTEKIKFFKTDDFKEFLQEAKEISPDQNDVDYFVLALKLNCPIWSEDKNLRKQNRVKAISTSELIRKLDQK